jgi:hypothetical protein
MAKLISKLPYRFGNGCFTTGSKAWHGTCSAPLCQGEATWVVLFHVEKPGLTVNRYEARCSLHGDNL